MKTLNWGKIYYLLVISRELDAIEEEELLPNKEIIYQFSARGHDFAQICLGSFLVHQWDGVVGYYRSRPLMLSIGVPLVETIVANMGKAGGYSNGRDIGVVCNFANDNGVKALPMGGGVGSQFTPVCGWAQGIVYRYKVRKEDSLQGAIAVAEGGDGAVATNGFWSAINIAATLKLPVLFVIEDNGYGLSVPSYYQTPGGDIADNLKSFKNLEIFAGDGFNPETTPKLIKEAVDYVRSWQGTALLRLKVPRLSGHSGQDTQGYKDKEEILAEKQIDPYPKVRKFLITNKILDEQSIVDLERKAKENLSNAIAEARKREVPEYGVIKKFIYSERKKDGSYDMQKIGGDKNWIKRFQLDIIKGNKDKSHFTSKGPRINMASAIRETLRSELRLNSNIVLFGEDVAKKGGVHGVTAGLQEEFGEERVFDTSLSEEGIIGRASGMAYAGLIPIAEIQFRKYADPAVEQLHDIGLTRWRTFNNFAVPVVVRTAGGFARCGDPWHSESDEAFFAHAVGWKVAYPSTAEDAVGLLRTAIRGNDPVFFFEHRYLLDAASARGIYPGDDFVIAFGKGKIVNQGRDITIVTWGAMVERAQRAILKSGISADIIDLRSVKPWDKELCLQSLAKTGRLLIVHEDRLFAGVGAEISSILASEGFWFLKSPVDRLAVDEVPLPYNKELLEEALPTEEKIIDKVRQLLVF